MDHFEYRALCAFVGTNLGVDEDRARYASRGPWRIARERTPEESWITMVDADDNAIAAFPGNPTVYGPGAQDAEHVQATDPAVTLERVRGQRAIYKRILGLPAQREKPRDLVQPDGLEPMLAMAQQYRYRSGWRQEWDTSRPQDGVAPPT